MKASLPLFKEIRIENTNSCGYKCVMCPREKLTRRIGYMPLDDFSLVLDRIGPFQGDVHLHGFGEPLLDRQLIEKIGMLKNKSPMSKSLIYSTLGVRLKEGSFLQLLESGLSNMVISLYGFNRDGYEKIHGYDGFDVVKKNLQLLSWAMKNLAGSFEAVVKIPSASIHPSLPVETSLEKNAFCSWLQELGFKTTGWDYAHNYSNGRSYNLPNSEKICPVIRGNRKNILNITWDLNVIPCCYDFNATIRFGNLREHSLEEIFLSPEYLAFVIAHQSNDLSAYPVCQGCEKNDYE